MGLCAVRNGNKKKGKSNREFGESRHPSFFAVTSAVNLVFSEGFYHMLGKNFFFVIETIFKKKNSLI